MDLKIQFSSNKFPDSLIRIVGIFKNEMKIILLNKYEIEPI